MGAVRLLELPVVLMQIPAKALDAAAGDAVAVEKRTASLEMIPPRAVAGREQEPACWVEEECSLMGVGCWVPPRPAETAAAEAAAALDAHNDAAADAADENLS